jgi:hypothetical protein
MSQVLMESAIGMLTAGMSTRAVAREFHVNFSTNVVLENLALCPTGLRPRVWHCVAERFADVNVVNRIPHGGGDCFSDQLPYLVF